MEKYTRQQKQQDSTKPHTHEDNNRYSTIKKSQGSKTSTRQ